MNGLTVSHSVNFGSSAMTSSAACFIDFWISSAEATAPSQYLITSPR